MGNRSVRPKLDKNSLNEKRLRRLMSGRRTKTYELWHFEHSIIVASE